MIYREYIDIRSIDPPATTFRSALQEAGLSFPDGVGEFTLRQWVEHDRYDPTHFNKVHEVVKRLGLPGRVSHGFVMQLSRNEKAKADLLDVNLGNIEVADDDFPDFNPTCGRCERPYRRIDYGVRAKKVRSKKSLGYYNGVALLASAGAREQLERAGVSGLTFVPFDEARAYFHIVPRTSLGSGVVHEHEFLDLNGTCEECGRLRYHRWFGPYRFRRADWSGDDFVSHDFVGFGILCSRRAFKAIKSIQRGAIVTQYAFLE